MALPTKAYQMTDSPSPDFVPTPIPTEAELASFDHRAVPSSTTTVGDVKIGEPVLAGLPPEMRQRIEEKMATVKADRAIFERQFIREELEKNSYRVKVLSGIHKEANEYERVSFGIMREIYHMQREADRISEELADVVGYSKELDEEGSPQGVAILRYQHEARRAREAALEDVRRRIRLLEGREGDQLRAEAAKVTQDRIRDQNERLQEDHEVRKLAAEKQRSVRIAARVDKIVQNRQHEMR